MQAVRRIAEEFKIQSYLIDATMKHKEPTLPIDVIRNNLNKYLDEIETDRLFNRGMNDLPNKTSLTLAQISIGLKRCSIMTCMTVSGGPSKS